MTTYEISSAILDELNGILACVPEQEVQQLKEAIVAANRVFVAGAGRSLLMMKCFAMRLMQTNFNSYVVGETTTPAIEPGDLLVIASGSGETGTLKVVAAGAKKAGAKIALITTNPASSVGQLSDYIVTVPASTPKSENNEGKKATIQPGASAFEQCVLILGDTLVISLTSAGGDLKDKNAGLMKMHANLE